VGLLIRRRDSVPTQFMGHDLKQFKSLEVSLDFSFIFVCIYIFHLCSSLLLSKEFPQPILPCGRQAGALTTESFLDFSIFIEIMRKIRLKIYTLLCKLSIAS
jgi:hypothetical protein